MGNPKESGQRGKSVEQTLPDYLAVFGEQPGEGRKAEKEYTFTAISDAQAEERMESEFPSSRWRLYRVEKDGQRREVRFHFEDR